MYFFRLTRYLYCIVYTLHVYVTTPKQENWKDQNLQILQNPKCLEEIVKKIPLPKMKYKRVAIFWLVVLPVLTFGFSQNRNPLNQVDLDEKSKLQTIHCEHYDAKCIEDANLKGSDASNCTGIEKCQSKSCYVVWKNETVTHQYQTSKPNLSHKSGKHVKKMGCIDSGTKMLQFLLV